MKYAIKIHKISTVDELPNSWSIEDFKEANDIIWDLQKEEDSYKIITSDYWISKTKFLTGELEANIDFFDK